MRETPAALADRNRPAMVQPELLRLLDLLPPAKQIELLDFARFLHQQVSMPQFRQEMPFSMIEVRTAPVGTLMGLTGLVSLGGDAATDTEALYDDQAGKH